MKKVFILVAIIFLNSILFAETIVDEAQLPQMAKDFISRVFSGVKISFVEKDRSSFEVLLSNGMKIDFNKKGEWQNIDSESMPIPFNVLPDNIISIIKSKYPDVMLIDVEKSGKNYKVKLSNTVEMVIRADGKIIKHELD